MPILFTILDYHGSMPTFKVRHLTRELSLCFAGVIIYAINAKVCTSNIFPDYSLC